MFALQNLCNLLWNTVCVYKYVGLRVYLLDEYMIMASIDEDDRSDRNYR